MTWTQQQVRVFKTAHFGKAAVKGSIGDPALRKAASALMLGQGSDLTGGVWKKRLQHNRYRGIVTARGGRHWFFVYLYAKSKRGNITDSELAGFQSLAEDYAKLKIWQIDALLANNALMEIHEYGNEA